MRKVFVQVCDILVVFAANTRVSNAGHSDEARIGRSYYPGWGMSRGLMATAETVVGSSAPRSASGPTRCHRVTCNLTPLSPGWLGKLSRVVFPSGRTDHNGQPRSFRRSWCPNRAHRTELGRSTEALSVGGQQPG